ncbi:MAG: hypothetical protein NT026_01840 [Candidatus Staskawiczbacteria bacterium]|nr:hypothetical protein [Candidatus Staskawiczbacteria bacterium]
MAKERERKFICYIEARGDVAYTNRVLASNIDEEDAQQSVLCKDGVRRDMWRCSSTKAFSIWSSRHNWEELGFAIRIWEQEGNGQIRIVSGKSPFFPYGRPGKKKRRPSHAKF